MDHQQERLDVLEQQMSTVTRQLRWWRGLAAGLLALAMLTWALPAGTADDVKHDDKKGLEQRVAALEKLLKHFSRKGNEVTIKGANLHLVNGLGRTNCGPQEEPIPDCPNGLGNLIVGYNEPRGFEPDERTGSHNVVVGQQHNFSRFGGLVVGEFHTISGDFAVVSGGSTNTASGPAAVVSGGSTNTASGVRASISGGSTNTASEFLAVVSGGLRNTATRAPFASVSGGFENTASGESAVVSGGNNRTAAGDFDWVAGSLVEDE